jgi:hypothetical protein
MYCTECTVQNYTYYDVLILLYLLYLIRKSIPRFSEVNENDFLTQAIFLWEDPSKYARL